MSDCIFCKIVAGNIPSIKIYEDDQFLGFMDINPLTRGHALLIPKAHYETLFSIPEDLLRDLIATAQHLAEAVYTGVGAKGLNLIQSNGRAANQIIDHFHLHLVPRYQPDDLKPMAWELVPGNPAEIADVAAAIKKQL
jgi:histidine triad (HIT) family protein